MDFVDLDKVLDQFEEEEKAAGEILPGQESKPSGYAEYLASHQDRPWETLSYALPADSAVKQNNLLPQTIAYDDPYDSHDRRLNSLKQSASHSNNIFANQQHIQNNGDHKLQLNQNNSDNNSHHHQHKQNNSEQLPDGHSEQDVSETKLKEQSIEAYLPATHLKEQSLEAYLPPAHLANEPHLPPTHLSNGFEPPGPAVKKEDERPGLRLIASVPASIQTDMLSPASERELLSYPLPKSDITVVGHGAQDTPDAHCSLNSQSDTNQAPHSLSNNSHYYTTHSHPDADHAPNTRSDSHLIADNGTEDSRQHAATAVPSAFEAHTPYAVNRSIDTEAPEQGSDGLGAAKKGTDPDSTGLADASHSSEGTGHAPTRSLQEEMAAAGFPSSDISGSPTAVGFEVGDGEMNGDEMEAYLQDLETGSLSGDDADEASPSVRLISSHADTIDRGKEGMSTGTFGTLQPVGDSAGDAGVTGAVSDKDDVQLSSVLKTENGGESRMEVTESATSISRTAGSESDVSHGADMAHRSEVDDSITDCHQDGTTTGLNGGSGAPQQQPDVVADISRRVPQAVTVSASSPNQGDVTVGAADTTDGCDVTMGGGDDALDGSAVINGLRADQASPPDAHRCDPWSMSPQQAAVSLDFPAGGSPGQLGLKGKLEIESLLDEMAAAKQARLRGLGGGTSAGDSTAPTDRDAGQQGGTEGRGSDTTPSRHNSSEPDRTEGWGPEGSMVCCMVRKPPPSEESPAPSSSPSPPLGVGARPKEPSQLKKSRPNSLLGLSKVSLSSPFSPPPHDLVSGGVAPITTSSADFIAPKASLTSSLADPSATSHPHIQSLGVRHLGAPPPPPSVVGTGPKPVAMDTGEEEEGEVMMRGGGERKGVEVTPEVGAVVGVQRPQSWGCTPQAASPSAQRTRRPTSLNLPVRQDRGGSLSPDVDTRTDADTGPSRKAEFITTPGAALTQDTESSAEDESGAAGDACGAGEGGVEEGVEEMGGEEEGDQGEGKAGGDWPAEAAPPSILHLNLGKMAPTWLPDAEATDCMQCAARFTFTKRRHHCRACGKIFCSACCSQKSVLAYLDSKEGRVCTSCHNVLSSAECVRSAGVASGSPNPNNPIEYCSTVPPTQQANARAPLPTVMVPSGVLKRQGSNRKSTEPKQVMFSDGIRPGGDLTELDGSDQTRGHPRRTGRAQKKADKQQGEHTSAKTRRLRGNDGLRNPCLIPEEGLPPVVVGTDEKGDVTLSDSTDSVELLAQIKSADASPVRFAVNLNLFVTVKIARLDCCVHQEVWCFTTEGMVTAGQEELVIVLETLPDELTVPRDVFCHFNTVYLEASKGNTVSNMGHSIFSQPFLDSTGAQGGHGGMLYVRPTFQCTQRLPLPATPFLFALLLHKWETPWAKVFPIRLMLRLGAEHRYYPCPLVSVRGRKPVFFEIGHTIMNLLADFRSFQYTLQGVRGACIHMQDKKTFINFPRNRYSDVMKVVSSSNEHVMALGGSFSRQADSHLVCIQTEEGQYQTQAINIQNKPRQVTGASFVVFNGALKSSAGLRAKSSIVEDGLMVQILPETMAALKVSLKDMTDFAIPCGPLTLPAPDEVVTVRWVDDDKDFNIGVKSPVDGMSLDGVESLHVHSSTDYVGERWALRWTDVFFLRTESGSSRWEPVDVSRVAETLATAVCVALTPHLTALRDAALLKIGLRVTLQPDSVGYEVGSNGERLPDCYMNDLDSALIPVIHGAITHSQDGPIVLELVLHVIH